MTNWYVRPSGGGGGGTTWTNAWNNLSGINWASVAAGDTIWVAGGTYSGSLVPTKNGTAANRIYVRRARGDTDDCTLSPGWNAAYASTITNTGGISTSYNYVTVSGATSATSPAIGWQYTRAGMSQGEGISLEGTASNNRFEWMELQGPGSDHTYVDDGSTAIIRGSLGTTKTANVFSHLTVHANAEGAKLIGCPSTVFEYVDMYDLSAANSAVVHPNGIYHGGCDNMVIRWSKFYGVSGVGCGMGIYNQYPDAGMSANVKIYGCLFYDLNNTGDRAISLQCANTTIYIWNNTFVNVTSPVDFLSGPTGSTSATAQLRNCLSYGTAPSISGGSISSNNLNTANSAIFSGYAGKDFHIVVDVGAGYPRNVGYDLSAQFTEDMDGVTFGADGNWDIGAYEYTAGEAAPKGTIALSAR